jgi:hypothetical protein
MRISLRTKLVALVLAVLMLATGMMQRFKIGGFILDTTEKPFGTVERI